MAFVNILVLLLCSEIGYPDGGINPRRRWWVGFQHRCPTQNSSVIAHRISRVSRYRAARSCEIAHEVPGSARACSAPSSTAAPRRCAVDRPHGRALHV